MYRVLLPVDTDVDRAVSQAEFVADLPVREGSVEADVAHAFTEEERDVPRTLQQLERVESVRRALEVLEDSGVETGTIGLSTPVKAAIIERAETDDFDLIVMGGRKRSPAKKALLGSVAQATILNAPVPVAVTGMVEGT
ncbi:MAG: universal stress protein [Halodesulfurarchaeum sp.]